MSKLFILPKKGERFTALWPCMVNVPIDGGGIEEQEITPRFKALKPAEVKAFFEAAVIRLANGNENDAGQWKRFGPLIVLSADDEGAKALLSAAIVDIPELKRLDKNGKPIDEPLGPDVLQNLIDLIYVRAGLLEGFFEFHTGAQEKNSEASSG